MEIIKKRLVKYYIYNRKQTNKAISLEQLSRDTKDVDEIISNFFARIDFNELSRMTKIASRESKRIILSKEDLKMVLAIMLKDLINNYKANSQDTAVYKGEYFTLILSLNRKGEHIITLSPNIDIL